MGIINQLSFEVANLIAAGEVVDRPASVIKELVENSIDAGATRITVELQRGGVRYMRVTDNGSGILPEDLPIAVRRHATSKIGKASDLDSISTLGFRGEALAAIAAVSDLRIISKTAGAELGASIEVNSGRAGRVTEQGAQNGTTVIVENLFANVPARLKFLKRDMTETAAALSVTEKAALSHPEIAFRFISDGNMKLSTPGDGEVMSAMRAVFGPDAAKQFIKVDGEVSGVRTFGYITSPSFPRSGRSGQNFFINHRYVKTATASAALEQAYTSYIPPEKFPGCVIFLELSPEAVDVNVHPSKLEVKFSNERPVFESVYHAVREALTSDTSRHSFTDAPEAETESADGQPAGAAPESRKHAAARVSESFLPVTDRADGPLPDNGISIADLYRGSSGGMTPSFGGNAGAVNIAAADGRSAGAGSSAGENPVEVIRGNDGERRVQGSVCAGPDASNGSAAPCEKGNGGEPDSGPVGIASAAQNHPPIAGYTIAGELFNTYILVTEGDRLTVIDKHAAHERLNFEKMRSRLKGAGRSTSLLALPIRVSLDTREADALSGCLGEIEKLGFLIRLPASAPGAGREAEITGIPSELAPEEAASLIERIAAAEAEGSGDAGLIGDTSFEKALYQASCKASIKGGRVYPEGYTLHLVDELMRHPEITYCPHGRPVAYVMSKREFDRRFGRI
ncbi:MAG: DNA mismatch repair endonuclease MutL [Clostridiales bacterium]|nr:DNA mismatch repair endonuclease MutL [Clostridiales bacterium]